MFNTLLYIGIGLILFCFLGFIFCEIKQREINRHTFEILRPKIKGKK